MKAGDLFEANTPRGLNRDTAGPADREAIRDRSASASCAPVVLDRSGTSTGGSHGRRGNAPDEPAEAKAESARRAPIPAAARAQADDGEGAGNGLAEPPEALAPSRARALGTCGTCGHGSIGRFGMIACGQVGSKASVNSAGLECLIDRWVPLPIEQQVKRSAQAGIDQAVAAADRQAPGWSEQAFDYLRMYAAQHAGKRITGYEIVQAMRDITAQPENPKAWGGPIQRAARAGHLVKVGTVPDPNHGRHGSDVPLWECCA